MARTKKADNVDNTRQKILAAATQLFCDKGIANTSLVDISKAAGISKGTLYYYFATKNDLIFDITEKHIQRITDELFAFIAQDVSTHSPEKILNIVFETILNDATRNRLHLYLVQEAIMGNEALKKRFQNRYLRWKFLLEEGIDRVLPDLKDKELLSQILVAVFDGLIIQKMLSIEDLPIRNIVQKLIE